VTAEEDFKSKIMAQLSMQQATTMPVAITPTQLLLREVGCFTFSPVFVIPIGFVEQSDEIDAHRGS
jgi:hypothetical protein